MSDPFSQTGHLAGLRAKIAKRDEKRRNRKPGKGAANGVKIATPQSKGGVHETAEQRKERLQQRRVRQLSRKPGFMPVPSSL